MARFKNFNPNAKKQAIDNMLKRSQGGQGGQKYPGRPVANSISDAKISPAPQQDQYRQNFLSRK